MSAARATARQQIVAGQRQRALDTLIGGLALDERDPELNRLVDELTGVARRTATEARAAAVVRGASPRSSAAFREGQAREREADTLLRAGDRVPGIRAAWAAAALYNKAPEGTGRIHPPRHYRLRRRDPRSTQLNRPPPSRAVSRSRPLLLRNRSRRCRRQ